MLTANHRPSCVLLFFLSFFFVCARPRYLHAPPTLALSPVAATPLNALALFFKAVGMWLSLYFVSKA